MKRIALSILAVALMSSPAMANDEYQYGKHGRYNYAYGTSKEFDTRQVVRLDGKDIASIQRALHREGYNAGPIDGVYGHRTRAAMKAFQYDRDLQGDGNVTSRTLKALKVSVARSAPSRIRAEYN
jgi:peptidoglycan hydrolase-like protein with peptidoglycan-binding domain